MDRKPLTLPAQRVSFEELSTGDATQRVALISILDRRGYKVRKAFQEYDAVDARNRFEAGELEGRWAEMLGGIETSLQTLAGINGKDIRDPSMKKLDSWPWAGTTCLLEQARYSTVLLESLPGLELQLVASGSWNPHHRG